ncbi:MAG: protein translocase subunit SecDF [Bacteroidales bacterium]|nr:protein translocase subunit SecDF [Bacteroidales bacterium]
MQNKGFVKIIALLLGLICLFYLSFSFVTRHYEGKAAAMSEVAGKNYLDSLRQQEVYLGYTYKQCEELQIGLGLDLKGGMNVILEVSVPDVVKGLADTNANDPQVKAAIEEAKAEAEKSSEDFLDVFIRKYQEKAGKNKLGGVFALRLKDANITPNSTDAEVRTALEEQIKAAVSNSYQVVQQRIDRFGVAQPNIQILEGRGQMGQIMVEMPGIKEPERVRKLLQGSANLEFWECYTVSEIMPIINSLDSRLAEEAAGVQHKDAAADSTKADAAQPVADAKAAADTAATDAKAALKAAGKDVAAADDAKAAPKADEKAIAEAQKKHPILSRLSPTNYQAGCVVGYVQAADTAAVGEYIRSTTAQEMLPKDLVLAWGVKPENFSGITVFELYALRKTNGAPALAGDVIESAKDDYDQYHRPIVSMNMNTDGARDWAMITKKNLKRPVAIVLDGVVYSAPTIQSEITGGSSQISGNFSTQDTQDLANVLTSGKTPAPTTIVSEETVGPSLGAASVKWGFISCIVAFVLLMIFMICFYGVIPGLVADSALLLNFFFTFGVLTSFQAALTMSGIAGLVLSLGMAVDANVLIYERTKEELRAGKQVKEALADGYGNAFSAIFDSNLTSIITAVILYNVGTGPIRGFAMTLGIGIVASFFTAVWISRIVYEHFLNKDKWTNLTFTTSLAKKFESEKEFAFMSQIKKSAIVFGIFIVASLASLGIRGLQQGIDFTGGRNYVVEFEKPVASETVKEAVQAKVGDEGTVSCLEIVTTSNPAVRISTSYKIEENGEEVDQEVEKLIWSALHDAKLINADYDTFKDRDNAKGGSIISAQKVGSSVAADMTRGAILATILSLFAIFIYILIRFRNVAFSVGAIAALTIDTFLIVGMYSICWGWMPFSLEVDQTFIGAILTAIGYSINDKVVVFDRIRENIGLYPTRDRELLFNQSLNSTLTRTIMTSITTLLVLLVIFFLGGDAIRSFAFAMILGVIFGTCSSIFLAAPIALKLIKKQVKKEAAAAAVEA